MRARHFSKSWLERLPRERASNSRRRSGYEVAEGAKEEGHRGEPLLAVDDEVFADANRNAPCGDRDDGTHKVSAGVAEVVLYHYVIPKGLPI
jgi:hypothetical protein